MSILLAIVLGLLFGFVLQKIGAANPEMIINMLRIKNLHLMKTILLGIGSSSLGLFILLAIGVVDPSHISVKASYVGVIIGGVILGAGWAISGFCPGTGVVALGAGRKDAVSFVLGGFLGALAFMMFFESMMDSFLFKDLGGKISLATTSNEGYPSLFPDLPGILVAGVLAVLFIVIAFKLPDKT